MIFCWRKTKSAALLLGLVACAIPSASPCLATVTVGHVDDFNDGTTQHWRIGQPGSSVPMNVADAGPTGAGDHALYSKNGAFGFPSRLIVLNEDNPAFPGPANWEGNWTTAGVTQVSLDVRSPTSGAPDLAMRLGIAGPGGTGQFGDVYFTDAITVPDDNMWHSIVFDVLAADWNEIGTDIDAALANVTQFRIFNNPFPEFIGTAEPGEFFLDNIRAIGAPAMLAGDYNKNDEVDAADYVLWRDTLDQSVTPGTGADGTGPSGTPDGFINNLDYDFWRARFGNTPPGAGSGFATSAVPEPSTWVLALGCLLALRRRVR